MFPGQGSQSPQMSKELLEKSSKARLVFEQAEDISGLLLAKICTQSEQYSKLQLTSYQQPAILTHSYAVWCVVQEELGLVPSYFAGHSLGEYSALVAAGKLSFESAISLVCARAEAMQDCVPVGVGGMLAVRTKDFELLSKLCFQVKDSYQGVLEVVNFNSPEQYILSGHMDIIDKICGVLKENKILARKLDVSAPFHSSLMKNARLKMKPLIEGASFCFNENYVIANLTGKLAHPYEPRYLVSQIDSPVLWSESIKYAESQDVNSYIEFGPQKILSSLVRRTASKYKMLFDTSNVFHSIKSIQKEFSF